MTYPYVADCTVQSICELKVGLCSSQETFPYAFMAAGATYSAIDTPAGSAGITKCVCLLMWCGHMQYTHCKPKRNVHTPVSEQVLH
jgi:hypothetical protein